MFIGAPGSGKTYFATRLAERLDAFRVNSDAMRLAIFGSIEKIDALYHSGDRQVLNSYVFGAMDYATSQALSEGKSVVFEAIQRFRSDRQHMEELATEHGAIAVLVWIKTDHDVALQRGMARDATADNRKLDEATMRDTIAHFSETLEPPVADEHVIEISGEMPFDEQYDVFTRELKKFL